MGHNEWDPDEFLDEYLEFDYRHPVPGHNGKHSKGLPADEVTEPKHAQKSFGLGDDFDLYGDLRGSKDLNAGKHASAEAGAEDLRSSDAHIREIPEPLSARSFVAPPKAESSGARASKPQTQQQTKSQQQSRPQPVPEAKENDGSGKSRRKLRLGHGRASELASGALAAAKNLVSSDEDMPPEEIPAAAVASVLPESPAVTAAEVSGYDHSDTGAVFDATSASEEEGFNDIDELFAELGETEGASVLSSEENEALAQAQQDAYDRYRENYIKTLRKKAGVAKVGFFPRWLSRIYVLMLAVFVAVMTVMNVLPFGLLVAFYVVLGLLSLIIFVQLRKGNVRKWVRGLASVTAVLLIGLFGVGTAYSLGTLSFLDVTSVNNENRVGSITKEPFNVCFTGMDVYGEIDEPGRSDVNMIMTVNPVSEQILLTSIPRDYEIYMPDKDMAMDKLTHTGFYSVDTTIKAEEQLLDTRINYYVKVNFTTVKAFIYAIGGIDVYSEYEFTPVKMKDWTVKKGWNHMNGKQAVAFARERKAFADGDNQRIKNQQAVFEAVLKKATSSKTMVLSYNKILSALKDNFRMSFSSAELRSLIKLQLARNPEWKIYKNTITGGDGSMPTYSTGNAYAYVMTQDQESIDNAKSLINAVIEGTPLDKDDDDNVYIVGAGSGTDEETQGEDTEG